MCVCVCFPFFLSWKQKLLFKTTQTPRASGSVSEHVTGLRWACEERESEIIQDQLACCSFLATETQWDAEAERESLSWEGGTYNRKRMKDGDINGGKAVEGGRGGRGEGIKTDRERKRMCKEVCERGRERASKCVHESKTKCRSSWGSAAAVVTVGE